MSQTSGELLVKQPERPKLLQILGPGLITGASDDDPSGIATYSQVGAQFGYGLAWTMVFSYPLMVRDPGDQRPHRPRHRLGHRRQSAPALSGPCCPEASCCCC